MACAGGSQAISGLRRVIPYGQPGESATLTARRLTSGRSTGLHTIHPVDLRAVSTDPNAEPPKGGAAVLELNDDNFAAEVLTRPAAVLVDVWAHWCGPCRLMAPLMTWAADTYAGRLTVGKLEADGNPDSRDAYKVQGLPTLILFRNGVEIGRHEGAMAKPQLQAFLDAHL